MSEHPAAASADDAPIEPASRFFTSEGLRLHYLDWGNPAAPTLILLHGNRDHARSWDGVARALRHRWHVVALDLRGHGDSEWSPDGAYLTPYHVLDLVALVEALGDAVVTIVGHSFGGNVAWRYTALHPEKVDRLVVEDGLGPAPDAVAKWDETGPVVRLREWVAKRRDPRAMQPRRLASVAAAAARMAAGNPHLGATLAHHLALHGVREHPDGYGWKHDPRVAMFTPEDFAVPGALFWRTIAIPVLLYYGTASWTTDPERDGRARHFRRRRTIVYEGAGHWVHHDRLDDFIATLVDFLDTPAAAFDPAG